MAINQSQLDFIIDQLEGIGEFNHKRMFGGVGFFKDEDLDLNRASSKTGLVIP